MPSHMGECCRWICQEVFRCLLLSGTRGRMVWSSIFTLLKSCCEFLSPWDSPHPFCLYSTTSPAISQLFFVKKIWIFFVRFIQKAREDTLPRSSVSNLDCTRKWGLTAPLSHYPPVASPAWSLFFDSLRAREDTLPRSQSGAPFSRAVCPFSGPRPPRRPG